MSWIQIVRERVRLEELMRKQLEAAVRAIYANPVAPVVRIIVKGGRK
jgi:hypothetical protein